MIIILKKSFVIEKSSYCVCMTLVAVIIMTTSNRKEVGSVAQNVSHPNCEHDTRMNDIIILVRLLTSFDAL